MESGEKKRRKLKARNPNPQPWIEREPPSAIFPSKEELVKLFSVIAIAASVAVACNYAAGVLNRRPNPFCDSGGVLEAPVSGLCEPCPNNGQCSNGELDCFRGYRKQGRICLEDGEINQMAKKLLLSVQKHVCDSYAQDLCGEAGKIWFQEADVLEILHEHKSKENNVKDHAFMLAKDKVMEAVESSLELRATVNGNNEFKCPELLAELHKPLPCCIRQWIYRHVLLLLAIFSMLVGLIRLVWTVHRKHYLSKRAEELYEQVCEILEENAMTAKSSTNEKGEPWVVASWLRDHLLLPRERKDALLWRKVEELVLEDSRIDQYPKLIKGESKIVLEWQVEGPLSSKMKSKGSVTKVESASRWHSETPQPRRSKVGEPQNP